jgi:hypothetical protein
VQGRWAAWHREVAQLYFELNQFGEIRKLRLYTRRWFTFEWQGFDYGESEIGHLYEQAQRAIVHNPEPPCSYACWYE